MREIDRVLARLPFAPIVAALFAVVAIVLVVATPQWLFERWMALSGIANAIPAATPPLGEKARFAAAIASGLVTGAVVWLLLTIGGKLLYRVPQAEDADYSDGEIASLRRPLSAENELGAPLMSDEAMAQARDELILETPLEDDVAEAIDSLKAADDPLPMIEIEELAVQPIEAVAPNPETVEAIQPVPMQPKPTDAETIPALLDRLEAAISRKPAGYRPDRADVTRLRRALGR